MNTAVAEPNIDVTTGCEGTVLTGLIATVTAVLGCAMFPDAGLAVSALKVWLASMSVLACIALIARWLSSWLAGVLMVFLLLYGAIMLRVPEAVFLLYLGIPVFFVLARNDLRLPPQALPVALIAAIAILGVSGAQTTFNMLQRLHAGEVHIDTLYHSAMAAMMKTYGVVSIGVDGLIVTEYHVFSHGVLAAISVMSGVSVVETYGLAPAILLAPLMIVAVGAAACATNLPFQRDRVPSLVFAIALVSLLLVILPAWYWKRALWASYFVSESYLLALIPMMIALPLMWRPNLTPRDWLLIAVAICVCALSKPSVAAIMIGLMLVRILFVTSGARSLAELAGFFAVAAALFVLQRSNADANQHYIAFNAFDFPLTYGRTTSAYRAFLESSGLGTVFNTVRLVLAFAGFYFAHFVVSWIALFVLFRTQDVKSALLNLPTLFVIAAVGVGVLMASTLDVAGGSLYYFTNVAMFVSLPIIIRAAWQLTQDFSTLRPAIATIVCLTIVAAIAAGPILKKARTYSDNSASSPLVTELISLKQYADSTEFSAQDPEALRRALPLNEPRKTALMFPVLTEHAWYGMIDPALDCDYAYHGYQSHRLSDVDAARCFTSTTPPDNATAIDFDPQP